MKFTIPVCQVCGTVQSDDLARQTDEIFVAKQTLHAHPIYHIGQCNHHVRTRKPVEFDSDIGYYSLTFYRGRQDTYESIVVGIWQGHVHDATHWRKGRGRSCYEYNGWSLAGLMAHMTELCDPKWKRGKS